MHCNSENYDELRRLLERLYSKNGEYHKLTCLFNALRWSKDSADPYNVAMNALKVDFDKLRDPLTDDGINLHKLIRKWVNKDH